MTEADKFVNSNHGHSAAECKDGGHGHSHAHGEHDDSQNEDSLDLEGDLENFFMQGGLDLDDMKLAEETKEAPKTKTDILSQ